MDEKLKATLSDALDKQAGDNPVLTAVKDFIFYIIAAGNHIDVAAELIAEKKTVREAFDAAADQARDMAVRNCACVEDKTVYAWVAEFLGLKGCITEEEIAAYCIGERTGNAVATETPKAPETENSSVSLDLGLDNLFD